MIDLAWSTVTLRAIKPSSGFLTLPPAPMAPLELPLAAYCCGGFKCALHDASVDRHHTKLAMCRTHRYGLSVAVYDESPSLDFLVGGPLMSIEYEDLH